MATPTSSSTRSRRAASKRPTSSKSRATRSKASNAKVTRSGQGGSRGSSTRVTRGSSPARAGTNSARVTGRSRPALPPGKKGGELSIKPRIRRRNITGNNSSSTTRQGTSNSPNRPQGRLPARATSANTSSLRTVSGLLGKISLLLHAGVIGNDLYQSLRRGEGLARIPGLISKYNEMSKKNAKAAINQSSSNRRGGPNRSGKPQEKTKATSPKTKPTASKPKTTPKKDRLDRDERRARERSRETPPPAPRLPQPPAARSTARPKPQAKPQAKLQVKPKSKVSKTHTYKEHGSGLHIGRHKTLAEHRAAVARRKNKKQSRANRAGYSGNQNY